MSIKIWDSTEWKMASQIKVWDGSAWQNGTNANVHIWTGSAWQKVHPGVYLEPSYFVTSIDISGSGAQAEARVVLFANGKIQTFTSTSTSGTVRTSSADWLITGTNSEYDVYVADFSGDALTGSDPTDGTRSRLNTDRTFALLADYPANKNAYFNLIICSNASTGTTPIQLGEVTLSAETSLV